jgi:anthranilate synthase component 2
MRLLLIDNYDSFTFNLVHYLEALNCNVQVKRPNNLKSVNYSAFDRIVISPGPKLPKDYPELYSLLDQVSGKIPILGVCLGHQLIGEYLKGELYNLSEVRHGVARQIKTTQDGLLFQGCPAELTVGLYHSWALKQKPESAFRIIATDEHNTIMAIENREKKMFGVQFHPESILTENGKNILSNFLLES